MTMVIISRNFPNGDECLHLNANTNSTVLMDPLPVLWYMFREERRSLRCGNVHVVMQVHKQT